MTKEELYAQISDAVLNYDEDSAAELSRKVIDEGYDAYEAIEKGLADGMDRAGVLFESSEYFVPELLLCSDAMYAGLEILKPHIARESANASYKVVLGVVEGDTHDIGKNLVKIMMEAAGFVVIDLGRDVPPQDFIDAAVENGAQLIMVSTLMTTTMESMEEVVSILKESNLTGIHKVLVGGGPVSKAYADSIGADGYAVNANEAVRLAKRTLGIET